MLQSSLVGERVDERVERMERMDGRRRQPNHGDANDEPVSPRQRTVYRYRDQQHARLAPRDKAVDSWMVTTHRDRSDGIWSRALSLVRELSLGTYLPSGTLTQSCLSRKVHQCGERQAVHVCTKYLPHVSWLALAARYMYLEYILPRFRVK